MLDYNQVVDDIQSFLQNPNQIYSDSLKELARSYAEACNEANQRLRRCADFLQQGLRPEAIYLAESRPALLDLVAAVDFPERSSWEQISVTYGLTPPPRLN